MRISLTALLVGVACLLACSRAPEPTSATPEPVPAKPSGAPASDVRPLPAWVAAQIGSAEHPIGYLSAFARCSIAFPLFEDGSSALLQFTTTGFSSVPRSLRGAATQNTFYADGIEDTADDRDSIRFPGRKFLYSHVKMPPPTPIKSQYETSDDFSKRQQIYKITAAQFSTQFSYVVEFDAMDTSDHTIFVRTSYAYNADEEAFAFLPGTTLIRDEGNPRIPSLATRLHPSTAIDSARERKNDEQLPAEWQSLLTDLRVPVALGQAPRLHPFLVTVVEVEDRSDEEGNRLRNLLSVQVRNVCTNETLAKINLEAK